MHPKYWCQVFQLHAGFFQSYFAGDEKHEDTLLRGGCSRINVNSDITGFVIVMSLFGFVLSSERAVSLSGNSHLFPMALSRINPFTPLTTNPFSPPHKSINPFLHSSDRLAGCFSSLLSPIGREKGVGQSFCPLAGVICG